MTLALMGSIASTLLLTWIYHKKNPILVRDTFYRVLAFIVTVTCRLKCFKRNKQRCTCLHYLLLEQSVLSSEKKFRSIQLQTPPAYNPCKANKETQTANTRAVNLPEFVPNLPIDYRHPDSCERRKVAFIQPLEISRQPIDAPSSSDSEWGEDGTYAESLESYMETNYIPDLGTTSDPQYVSNTYSQNYDSDSDSDIPPLENDPMDMPQDLYFNRIANRIYSNIAARSSTSRGRSSPIAARNNLGVQISGYATTGHQPISIGPSLYPSPPIALSLPPPPWTSDDQETAEASSSTMVAPTTQVITAAEWQLFVSQCRSPILPAIHGR